MNNEFLSIPPHQFSEAELSLFWFRRDLRLEDNAGLYYALKENSAVIPIFIFDTTILSQLEDHSDKRVLFIHQTIKKLKKQLQSLGTDLVVLYGNPVDIYKNLIEKWAVKNVYANHDYEPYAIERDAQISNLLKEKGIVFKTFKDQVIFEKNEVVKGDGKPYTMFSPYMRAYKEKLSPFYVKPYPTQTYFQNFLKINPISLLSVEDIGFKNINFTFPGSELLEEIIKNYHENRDYPSMNSTSKLSVHLRFGTISIRSLVSKALQLNETWLNELIWRDFYMGILYHFPHVTKGAFKKEYNAIVWENNEENFRLWCEGKTGYPIVDAGMRELNKTGFMHNRLRMITASFLCKHLLIDWRWGEAYFSEKLIDFDLAANNGGWQWAASTGCDAVPYFRIFNPSLQTEKFDPELKYIRSWVPEFDDPLRYPKPMVDHVFARNRAIERYKAIKNYTLEMTS